MPPLPPRVLITDPLSDLSIEREALPGIEVEGCPAVADEALALAQLIAAVERRPVPVLVVGSGTVLSCRTLETLAGRGVHGIVCASVGYDHVDLAAAVALGITVCNVPDYGTDDVADHAMALLLWCLRGLGRVTPATPDFWATPYAPLRRLSDCTLALLGFGRIGQAVARRADAFGLMVRWYDPYVPRGQDKATRTNRVESLAELLAGADAVSIHCLLSAETRRMIDASALALLPDHAVLVNTARGPIVDEAALLSALQAGRLGGVALDVLEQEPPGDTALATAYGRGELPRVLISPHMAWYSEGSAVERRRKAAQEAGRLLRGEQPYNRVGV